MFALHSNFEESFLKFIDPFCPSDKKEKERFTLTTRDLICKAIRQSTPRVQIHDPFFQCRYDVTVIAQETGIDLFMSSTKELSDKKGNEAFFHSNFFKNDEVSVLSTLTEHVVFYGTRPYFPQDLKEKIDLRKLPAHTNFGFILRGKKDDDIKEHFQGMFNLTFYPLKVETDHRQAYFPICGSSDLQGYRRLRWTEEDEKEFWDEMVREIVQGTPLEEKFVIVNKTERYATESKTHNQPNVHVPVKNISLDEHRHLLIIQRGKATNAIPFKARKNKKGDTDSGTKVFNILILLWENRKLIRNGRVSLKGDFVSMENLQKVGRRTSIAAVKQHIKRLNARFKEHGLPKVMKIITTNGNYQLVVTIS